MLSFAICSWTTLAPTEWKKKTAGKKKKKLDLHHFVSSAFPGGVKKNKDNCLFLPFFNSILSPARTLQHTLVSTDTSRSPALSVFSRSISLTHSSPAPLLTLSSLLLEIWLPLGHLSFLLRWTVCCSHTHLAWYLKWEYGGPINAIIPLLQGNVMFSTRKLCIVHK